MGKHFGNLVRLKGVTFYSLSPNVLNPFKGILNPGITNTIRRFRENIFTVGIPVIYAYTAYTYGKRANEKIHRKNPADFENDE